MVEKNVEEHIFKCMENVVDTICKSREERLLKSLEERLNVEEAEFNKTLTKGFGLEEDPVAHLSDLIKHTRKVALLNVETGKRTPTAETVAGPEGNIQLSEVDKMFEKAKKGEL